MLQEGRNIGAKYKRKTRYRWKCVNHIVGNFRGKWLNLMYCAGCIGSDNKILSYYYDCNNNYYHTCQSFQKVPSCSNFIEGFFRSICFERKTCGVSIIEACSIQKNRELQPFLIHHPILSLALIKEPLLTNKQWFNSVHNFFHAKCGK